MLMNCSLFSYLGHAFERVLLSASVIHLPANWAPCHHDPCSTLAYTPVEPLQLPSGPTPSLALQPLTPHAISVSTLLSLHRTAAAPRPCPIPCARARPCPPWTLPTVHRVRGYKRAPRASCASCTTSSPPQLILGRTAAALALSSPSSVQSTAAAIPMSNQ